MKCILENDFGYPTQADRKLRLNVSNIKKKYNKNTDERVKRKMNKIII